MDPKTQECGDGLLITFESPLPGILSIQYMSSGPALSGAALANSLSLFLTITHKAGVYHLTGKKVKAPVITLNHLTTPNHSSHPSFEVICPKVLPVQCAPFPNLGYSYQRTYLLD